MISRYLAKIDPEIYPKVYMDQLDAVIKTPGIWRSLNHYANRKDVGHLVTANDALSQNAHMIYQLGSLSGEPESIATIERIQKEYDTFREDIEETQKDYAQRVNDLDASITTTVSTYTKLDKELLALKRKIGTRLTTWQTEFSEAQTDRNKQYSDAQIERNTKYNELLETIKSDYNNKAEEIISEYTTETETLMSGFADNATAKATEIQNKYDAMLKMYGLTSTDTVGARFKQAANSERWFSVIWSVATVLFYGLIFAWVIFKGRLGFGIEDGLEVDWPVLVTTIAVTAISFTAAQFAARQARVHRLNEQRMRWFSFEVDAIGPFIQELKPEEQQALRKQLTEKLFGQDRAVEEQPSKSKEMDLKTLTTSFASLKQLMRSLKE